MRQILTSTSLNSTRPASHSRGRINRSQDKEPVGYRLHPNVRRILNQLIHFENSILVVRSNGLSCSRTTSFGAFHPVNPNQTDSLFIDRESGLMIDRDQIQDIFVIDWISSGTSLEILFKEDGFAISIELGKSAYSEFIISHLIESYGATIVAPTDLWNAGAGAWLDEWEQVQSRGILHRSPLNQFTASFEGSGFRFRIKGKTLSDFPESNVHRITALGERTYIFAHDSVILNSPTNKPHITHGKN